ncbi:MAG: hypothetical protein OXU28_05255 [Chloroflexota bacterium]|nr:hypothetical protein [Chloroflexota bacterium]
MPVPQLKDFSLKKRTERSLTLETAQFGIVIRHRRTGLPWEAVAYDKNMPYVSNLLIRRYETCEEALSGAMGAIQQEWLELYDDGVQDDNGMIGLEQRLKDEGVDTTETD